eukprot:m.185079 g.185079  ORF g.185079 m.185079 type:complete len:75 (-) comp24716_c0_seq1:597-821(-)
MVAPPCRRSGRNVTNELQPVEGRLPSRNVEEPRLLAPRRGAQKKSIFCMMRGTPVIFEGGAVISISKMVRGAVG